MNTTPHRHRGRSATMPFQYGRVTRQTAQAISGAIRYGINEATNQAYGLTGPPIKRSTPEIGLVKIIVKVRSALGNKLTAYVGRASDVAEVENWISGERVSPDVEFRMRIAGEVVSILGEYEKPAVMQAWFLGQNPHLGHKAPLRILREGELSTLREKLLGAAKAFLAGV